MRNFSKFNWDPTSYLSAKNRLPLTFSLRADGPRGCGIIAVLFAILALSLGALGVTLSVTTLLDDRNTTATQEKLRQIAFAISRNQFSSRTEGQRQYETDVGALPSSLTDLTAKPGAVAACSLNASTQLLTGWCGPYLETVFQGENVFADGWGTTITYQSGSRTLRSFGPNRTDNGGAGDDLVQGF